MTKAETWNRVAALVDGERRQRGLTIKAVADRAGVDESTARRVLGAEPIRLGSLRAITTSLGLGWSDLLLTVAEPEGVGLQLSESHR